MYIDGYVDTPEEKDRFDVNNNGRADWFDAGYDNKNGENNLIYYDSNEPKTYLSIKLSDIKNPSILTFHKKE